MHASAEPTHLSTPTLGANVQPTQDPVLQACPEPQKMPLYFLIIQNFVYCLCVVFMLNCDFDDCAIFLRLFLDAAF